MTRYFVHMADELYRRTDFQLPDGFRIIGVQSGQPRRGVRTVAVEDDSAPPALEGMLVDVVFRTTEAGVEIVERNVVVCGAPTGDPTEPGATCALSPHVGYVQHESANTAGWRRALP